MPVLPLDCHLPTQYTTHTITLQQWTNNKTNKSYKQLIYIYIYISHVNVTQTVPDISPLMPMHQYPLLVCHFMMTLSNANISRVCGPLWGDFTGHRWISLTRPVTRTFDVFFDLHLNKGLSKPSRRRWFETPSRSLWRHRVCDKTVVHFLHGAKSNSLKICTPSWMNTRMAGEWCLIIHICSGTFYLFYILFA